MANPTPISDNLLTFLLEHDDYAPIDPATIRPRRSRHVQGRHRSHRPLVWHPDRHKVCTTTRIFVLRVVPSRERALFRLMRERLCEQPLPITLVYPGSYGPPGVLWTLGDFAALPEDVSRFLAEFGRVDRQLPRTARRRVLKSLAEIVAS